MGLLQKLKCSKLAYMGGTKSGKEQAQPDICFGRWRLSPGRRRLLADGVPITLGGRAFDVLLALVEARGEIVTKEALMRRVWPGAIVEENNLQVQISTLRKTLGRDADLLITTVPRRGYCFTCKWQWREAAATSMDAENASTYSAYPVSPIVLPFGRPGSEAGQDIIAHDIFKETPPRPPTGRPIVVVLPFDNLGGDTEQNYLVDGLTADLITDLSRFQSLHIVGPLRGSGWSDPILPATRGAPVDAPPRRARYLVKGTVRRAGARIRVTAQLEDAESGMILWSGRFDRQVEDLFVVQEELAQRVAGGLVANIDREALGRAKRQPPVSLDAYELCLRGRELHDQGTEAGTLAAREMFDRAITADPDYASAYALNAFAVQRAITHGWGEPQGKAALDLALDLAHRAAALEPGSSLCLSRLAFVLLLCQGRGNEAVEVGRSGVFANPSDSIARYSYGHALTHTGNPELAIEELRLSLELNPFHSALMRAGLGRALLLAGRREEAIVELHWCAARAPDWGTCHAVMVVAFVEMGLMDEARAALRNFRRLRPAWQPCNFEGPWHFHQESDARRVLAAFRAAER
jgi:TolB-like protein/DNA-binding winged helix-turn-helix (wHTH) protein/Flp pilus assembly protein TadD